MRYVKLVDGGITNNNGLSNILIARAVSGTPYGPPEEGEAVMARRMLFLVVDAGRPPAGEWAKQQVDPSGVEVAGCCRHRGGLSHATEGRRVCGHGRRMARQHDPVSLFAKPRAVAPSSACWADDKADGGSAVALRRPAVREIGRAHV